jgi:Polysaccharide pyruvyl transferase
VAYTIATHLNMSMHVRCNEDGKKTAIPPPSHHLTFAFIGSFAGPANRDVNPTSLSTNTGRQNSTNQRRYSIVAPQSMSYRNILLGMGLTDAKGSRISTRKVPFADVLGVRGPLTRDLYLMKQGINPEVVGDPGLYFSTIFGNEVDEARRLASMSTDQAILDDGQAEFLLYQTIKDLCFISHEVEHNWFVTNLNEYQNVTLRAGKLGDGGNIYDAVKFISTCKAIVSSSLHGVVFAHSLSIPALPIQVTDKLYGGDFKFYDYYYSINVTNFHGRYSINNATTPNTTMVPKKSKDEWIQLVKTFPQPTFPFNNNNVHILDIVKALYQK